MTRLLPLAQLFPFIDGSVAAESYLETEIGYLAEAFDEVWAVGTEAPAGATPTCALSGNVRPVALGCARSRAGKLSLALRGQLLAFPRYSQVRGALEETRMGTAFTRSATL